MASGKSDPKELNFDAHELANEELRYIYRGRNRAALVVVLSGAIAAGMIWWNAGKYIAGGWFAWLLATNVWHWLMGRSDWSSGEISLQLAKINRHITAAGLAGLGWGGAAVVLPWLDYASGATMLVIMIVAVIMALPRLVVFLPIFSAFTAGVYVPLILMLPFFNPDTRHMVLLVLTIVGIMLWFSAGEVRKILIDILLKQISSELSSWKDKLTGLGNRRRFDDNFDAAWRQATRLGVPLSLIILDVDNFKKFNDAYGHQAGDDCLRQVATSLENSARRAGDSVSRYGGEEFAVVLFHTPMNEAKNISEKLREAVMSLGIKHEHSNRDVVTISIGGATAIPTTAMNMESLLKQADEALYRAKQQGRNRVEWNMLN